MPKKKASKRKHNHENHCFNPDALRRYYPDNAYIALYSASVFENSGRLPQALAETERSISLVRAQGLDPNELQVSMLEAKHERISKRMAANEN